MVVGEIAEGVDLLVVGGGPGGYAAALHAARLGRRVTLVERDGGAGLGGVCLRRGCIPSKALIEVADLAHRGRSHPALRLSGTADLAAFQTHKAGIVAGLTGGVAALLAAAGVDVLAGELRFTRADRAVLHTPNGRARFLEFRDVVLATGSRPVELPGLPVDGVAVLDSSGALDLDRVPESVAVVGAGYVGVELGTALAKLGARVTLVEVAERVLPDIDAALVRPVVRRLAELGVALRTAARAEGHDGRTLRLAGGGAVDAQVVVVAIGRRPNTDDLGLDRLGVTPRPDGLLEVGPDRTLRAHVAAVGDVTPGPALAHKAYAEAEVAVAALCGRPARFDPLVIPAVVFADPEIAMVGITAGQARALGARVTTVPMTGNGRALTLGATGGLVQVVTEAGSGAVIGLHVVGPHASELAGEAAVAIETGALAEDLADVVHVHPTVSEQIQEAARQRAGRALHTAPARADT